MFKTHRLISNTWECVLIGNWEFLCPHLGSAAVPVVVNGGCLTVRSALYGTPAVVCMEQQQQAAPTHLYSTGSGYYRLTGDFFFILEVPIIYNS